MKIRDHRPAFHFTSSATSNPNFCFTRVCTFRGFIEVKITALVSKSKPLISFQLILHSTRANFWPHPLCHSYVDVICRVASWTLCTERSYCTYTMDATAWYREHCSGQEDQCRSSYHFTYEISHFRLKAADEFAAEPGYILKRKEKGDKGPTKRKKLPVSSPIVRICEGWYSRV